MPCVLHDFVTSLVTIAWQAADTRPPRSDLCCILHDFVTSLVGREEDRVAVSSWGEISEGPLVRRLRTGGA